MPSSWYNFYEFNVSSSLYWKKWAISGFFFPSCVTQIYTRDGSRWTKLLADTNPIADILIGFFGLKNSFMYLSFFAETYISDFFSKGMSGFGL